MKTTIRRKLFILVFALLVLEFGMVIPVFPFIIDINLNYPYLVGG